MSDAVDKPLRPMANRFCGCSVWALAPFLLFFGVLLFASLFLLWRNASLAGGFAGRRVWLVLVVLVCCFYRLPAQMDMICPCTNAFLAYAHVRTEPLARHRPHSRKKKRVPRHQLSCEDDSDIFFSRAPLPFGGSAGNRTTSGSLSETQEFLLRWQRHIMTLYVWQLSAARQIEESGLTGSS